MMMRGILSAARPVVTALTAAALVAGALLTGTSRAAATSSLAALEGAAASPPAPSWIAPLGPPLRVSEPYREPATRYASGHRGIDIEAAPGDVVFAPQSGIVTFAGKVADREVVTVEVRPGFVYSMEPVDADAARGVPVTRGSRLGTVARGGHCTDECVHLGVRVNGEYTNPMRYLSGKPVLLPW